MPLQSKGPNVLNFSLILLLSGQSLAVGFQERGWNIRLTCISVNVLYAVFFNYLKKKKSCHICGLMKLGDVELSRVFKEPRRHRAH